jgi:hypothetical protein
LADEVTTHEKATSAAGHRPISSGSVDHCFRVTLLMKYLRYVKQDRAPGCKGLMRAWQLMKTEQTSWQGATEETAKHMAATTTYIFLGLRIDKLDNIL